MVSRNFPGAFLVVGLTLVCLLLAAPGVHAARYGISPPNGGNGEYVVDPPVGDPGGGGAGDGGDPDDYANLLRSPDDPLIMIADAPDADAPATSVGNAARIDRISPDWLAILIWLGVVR